jgi:hypothetical protein
MLNNKKKNKYWHNFGLRNFIKTFIQITHTHSSNPRSIHISFTRRKRRKRRKRESHSHIFVVQNKCVRFRSPKELLVEEWRNQQKHIKVTEDVPPRYQCSDGCKNKNLLVLSELESGMSLKSRFVSLSPLNYTSKLV